MKTVLITGANGGLGAYLAKRLLRKGYFVILNYHNNDANLLPLLKEYPQNVYLLQGDVSQEKEVLRMKEECDKLKFQIDVLVNNAAIDHVSEVKDKNEASFLEVFRVNTLSVFLMCKVFGEDIDKRNGSIINISSDNAIDQYDIVTMEYDVSKAGVNMLTYDFAKYYKNAKINAIAFGWLDTPMNIIPDDMKKFIHFVSLEHATTAIIELIETTETGKVIVCR